MEKVMCIIKNTVILVIGLALAASLTYAGTRFYDLEKSINSMSSCQDIVIDSLPTIQPHKK